MSFIKILIQLFQLHRRSILYYLAVGIITFGIYLGVFSFLYEIVKLHYKFAISIAYILAISFHFFVNRKVTFKAHGHQLHVQLAKYFIMISFNYLITLGVMHIIVEHGFSPYFGMLCSIALTVSLNYIIAKIWVFHVPHHALKSSEEI